MNPLKSLEKYDQSFWLDYIRHDLLAGHELTGLIERDGLKGMTSNPAIFEKAIHGDPDYQNFVRGLRHEGLDAKSIYEVLAIRDIRGAAHRLTPVYAATNRRDGYVSLEVSPHLAYDTEGTILEARRLWQAVGYDNLMIKVPATTEGIPAIARLIAEGINVNATLIFSRRRYRQVAEAYLLGLERLSERGGDLGRVASVASFFVSRIDTDVDALLANTSNHERRQDEIALAESLMGKAGISNARLAYRDYRELVATDRWLALAKLGATPQRLLWASTGVKNPNYSDLLYVEELIGRETVNTMPPATADAFREHGRAAPTLDHGVEQAERVMDSLAALDISLEEVCGRLLEQGVRLFEAAFDALLGAVSRHSESVAGL